MPLPADRRQCLLACIALAGQAFAAALPASQAVAPAQRVAFPTIHSASLDKRPVTLPSGLEGEVNLLVLSFARDQQAQVESWTPVAQALTRTDVHFRAYRMPVAERENALFRWWANASLRSAESDPDLWHWTVPIYVDLRSFRAQLGIADEKTVTALLVDRSGRVLWRATGTATAAARASLMAAAQAANPAPLAQL